MISNTMTPAASRVLNQALMLVGLLMIPTVLGVFIGAAFHPMGWLAVLGAFILAIVLLIGISVKSNDGAIALPLTGMFAVVMGFIMSSVLVKVAGSTHGFQVIAAAGVATLVTFTVAAIYGAATKRDLTQMGSILFIALIAMVVVGLINMFIGSSVISLVLSCIGVVVFTLYTVYDVNQVVTGGVTNPILAALNLYLNILNLFLDFLKIFSELAD